MELKTIQKPSAGSYKEKGSRFLAFLEPVSTLDQSQLWIASLRKEYYDARHVCSAVRLGETGEITKVSDDGEPAHSAGDPILRVLKSEQLTMAAIAVVRYFGGIKLGVGGLIHAYESAAKDAVLQNSSIQPFIPMNLLTLEYDYDQTSQVQQLLKKFPDLALIHGDFQIKCFQKFCFPKNITNELQQWLSSGFLNWTIESYDWKVNPHFIKT